MTRMNTRSLISAFISVTLAASCLGVANARAEPPPPPAHGRGPYGHGSGIILVEVEPKTGKVIAARMLESTGSTEFDSAAIKAFRTKRFKPGTAPQLRIPISYRIKGKKL